MSPPPEVARGRVTALILAAGGGVRMGDRPKAFLELGGRTLLERAVDLVTPFAAEIVVGLRPEDVARGRELVPRRGVTVAAGGATRQQTAARLLKRAGRALVLLHDVARPAAPAALVARVLAAAEAFGAACPVVAASERDSVALRDGEDLGRSLPRADVVRTQTPQAFRRELLIEAHRRAEAEGWRETSTAFLVARAGRRVRLVPGEARNLKITFAGDLARVAAALEP